VPSRFPTSRTHPKTPPYLRRRVVQFVIAIIAVTAAGLVVMWLAHGRLPLYAYIVASTVPGAGCGVVSMVFATSMHRHMKRARGMDGRVCWSCGYSLHGLDDDGRCPECGHDYTLSDLRDKWMVPKV